MGIYYFQVYFMFLMGVLSPGVRYSGGLHCLMVIRKTLILVIRFHVSYNRVDSF